MKYLYDPTTGLYEGMTNTPEDFPTLSYTTVIPQDFDDIEEQLYFVDGAWEIREI